MTKVLNLIFIYLGAFIMLSSCASNRNLAYFSNLNTAAQYEREITNRTEPVIQAGDLLSITINSLNPESNTLLNSEILLPPNSPLASSEATRKASEGYLVDKAGMIKFPVLGDIQLGGLTRNEAISKMTALIEKSVKSPTVNIVFLNFRVTVLGEVNRPASFVVPNEHITLLEALGMAGDMTPYGRREQVLLIREKGNSRTVTRLDLTNKEVLSSPYFYLQQNDVVYVEPDRARSLQASTRAVNLPIYISIASVAAIIISSLALVLRN